MCTRIYPGEGGVGLRTPRKVIPICLTVQAELKLLILISHKESTKRVQMSRVKSWKIQYIPLKVVS